MDLNNIPALLYAKFLLISISFYKRNKVEISALCEELKFTATFSVDPKHRQIVLEMKNKDTGMDSLVSPIYFYFKCFVHHNVAD
jgi:hypothetical protein